MGYTFVLALLIIMVTIEFAMIVKLYELDKITQDTISQLQNEMHMEDAQLRRLIDHHRHKDLDEFLQDNKAEINRLNLRVVNLAKKVNKGE